MNGIHVLMLMTALGLIFYAIHRDGYEVGREHGRTEYRKQQEEAAEFYDHVRHGV